MKTNTPHCLMPWIHFHVNEKGNVKACCVANIPYGNINQQSFEDIWQGEAITKLRTRFLKGQRDNRCAACYKIEEAGGKSIRQETLEKYSHIDTVSLELPFYFDIRFSNVCNFRCRTCWHGASSGWFSEAKQLKRNIADKAVLTNIDDFGSFIAQMGTSLLQAKEIYFAGGEPLITEEHYLLLQWLIDNKATDIFLRYNTNFSHLNFQNYDVIELWRKFTKVEILASIDASENLGEYIRKGFIWNKFLENRKRLGSLPHVEFKIAPTLSVFNIKHLPQLYSQCVAQNIIHPDGFYLNLLHRPLYFNVKSLPTQLKLSIEAQYQKFLINSPLPKEVKRQFVEVLNFMMAEDLSKQWPAFQKETALIDKLRKENLATVLPSLNQDIR